MKIIASALVASGNQDLVGMAPVEIGTIPFPSGGLAILEPMTYFTEIDAEIAARRIEVPGPAVVTAIMSPAEDFEGKPLAPRPYATVLTFSDADAVTRSVVGEINIDVARIMFADAGLLTEKWARDEEGYKASKTLSLDDALAQNLLTVGPIYAAEQATDGHVLLSGSILTSLTGWGDCTCQVVRHDDADGNLVRVVVSYLEDDCCVPIDFLDFGLPAPLALAA